MKLHVQTEAAGADCRSMPQHGLPRWFGAAILTSNLSNLIVCAFAEHTGSIYGISVSAAQPYLLATASDDETVRLHKIGHRCGHLMRHVKDLSSLAPAAFCQLHIVLRYPQAKLTTVSTPMTVAGAAVGRPRTQWVLAAGEHCHGGGPRHVCQLLARQHAPGCGYAVDDDTRSRHDVQRLQWLSITARLAGENTNTHVLLTTGTSGGSAHLYNVSRNMGVDDRASLQTEASLCAHPGVNVCASNEIHLNRS